jgi:hypothetical protein
MVVLDVQFEAIGAVESAVKDLLSLATDEAHLRRVADAFILIRTQGGKRVDDDSEDDVQHRNRNDEEKEDVLDHHISNVGNHYVSNAAALTIAVHENVLEAAPERAASVQVCAEVVIVLHGGGVVCKLCLGWVESELLVWVRWQAGS